MIGVSTEVTDDLAIFRRTARRFLEKECVPNLARWEREGVVDRDLWKKAGAAGLLCIGVPDEYGGAGATFAHEVVFIEELSRARLNGWGNNVHSSIVAPYILLYGSEEQKRRWLPRMASGDLVAAIAMSEPGTGSDLQGVRTTARLDGSEYIISGQKTFITNGQQADLVCVVAKTDPAKGAKGISLIMIEANAAEGFRRGRNLEKVGQHAADTSELYFDDVRVPSGNLLGEQQGTGFQQLMEQLPRERLVIAVGSLASMERAIELTLEYTKNRTAFGQQIFEFQNTKFKLAEAKTKAVVARAFLDQCIAQLAAGKLDQSTAAMAKWWTTQVENEIMDECLQLHGGYGFMAEYPISRMWTDARVQKIYGGTNEIMKQIIARSL